MREQPAPNVVMGGLVPAIHELNKLVVKVVPMRIRCKDQAHFPSARPMLHIPLATDGRGDIRVWFGVNQPLQAVAFRKPLDQTFSMLPGAMPDMAGNTSVKCTIRPVGNYIDPGAFHLRMVSWMAGTKPGHDGNAAGIGATITARSTVCSKCSKKS